MRWPGLLEVHKFLGATLRVAKGLQILSYTKSRTPLGITGVLFNLNLEQLDAEIWMLYQFQSIEFKCEFSHHS
jgi:hypothetical protein